MKLYPVWGLLFAATVLLAGCIGSQPSIPAEKFYRLAPPAAASTPQPPSAVGAATYALESVDARGVFVERALLYRSAAVGSPLQQYPYASWAEPPDVMLQDLLLSALRGTFGASQVLMPGQSRAPAIRVSMRLHAMEQVRDGSEAKAHFAATFTAQDHDGAVLFVLDFDREAPASGASPLEFVTALSGLVNDADREVVERLRDAAAKAPPTGS